MDNIEPPASTDLVAASSQTSLTSLQRQRLEQELGERLKPTDIAKIMDRLSANYGPPRDRTPEQVRLMVAEWFRALSALRLNSISHAVDRHLRTSKWWPTLAEIHEAAKAHQAGWVDALGIGVKPSYRAGEYRFARDGRTEAEEIAHRAAMTKRWRADAAAGQPEYTDPIEAKPEPKAASQSNSVSYALYHSCAARRARGEQTCEERCQRPGPGVRRCHVDAQQGVADGMDAEDVGTKSAASDDARGSEAEDKKWSMRL